MSVAVWKTQATTAPEAQSNDDDDDEAKGSEADLHVVVLFFCPCAACVIPVMLKQDRIMLK